MFSRARIFGHPIHPMIVPLPITSFLLALVTTIVFAISGLVVWMEFAYWLAIFGVVTGLAAAAFGLVDYLAIPSSAAAKPVGTLHMVLNLSIVLLFFVSWLMMGGFSGPAVSAVGFPLVLQVIGVVLLTASGWLGAEMVYRHHVGVEPVSAQEAHIVEEHEEHRRAA